MKLEPETEGSWNKNKLSLNILDGKSSVLLSIQSDDGVDETVKISVTEFKKFMFIANNAINWKSNYER